MKELFFISLIVIVLLLIYRRLSRKIRSSDCGVIYQLLQKRIKKEKERK